MARQQRALFGAGEFTTTRTADAQYDIGIGKGCRGIRRNGRAGRGIIAIGKRGFVARARFNRHARHRGR